MYEGRKHQLSFSEGKCKCIWGISIDRCRVISDDPEKGLVEQCLPLPHSVSMTKRANKIPGIVREDAERKRDNAVFPQVHGYLLPRVQRAVPIAV